MTIKTYYYYSKIDSKQEKLNTIIAPSRLSAAKLFAQIKRLDLKSFLTIYSISK